MISSEFEVPLVIYVDVDDTFVRTYGTKRIVMPGVVAHIRQLHQDGTMLYCWSSVGAAYAKASAEEFGIGDCFVAFLPKPQVCLDDQRFDEWRTCLQVHPTGLRSAAEYRVALRRG